MRLEEEYVKTGYFWFPGKEEEKIPGILTISDGGEIELDINGPFGNGNNDLSRIIGHVEKDGPVTLEDCSFPIKGIPCGAIRVSRVLSGFAYGSDDEVTFNTFSFSVDCLDEWVGVSGIGTEENTQAKTATISYELPKKITHKLDNEMDLEIVFAYTLSNFPNKTEAKITQEVSFRLVSESLLPMSDFMGIAYKLTHLMCFAMDTIVSMKKVVGTSSEIQQNSGDGTSKKVPIYIYYESIPYTEVVPSRNWSEMLFGFRQVESKAKDIFNNWINAYDTLAPAMNLYFSTKLGAQRYIDGKFLALAQGLETYHRRTSKVKKLTLKERLEQIIEPFVNEEEIEEMAISIVNKEEIEEMVNSIVRARNYLTHYSDDSKSGDAEGRKLLGLYLRMDMIFQLHFLKLVGFTDDEIGAVVKSSDSLTQKLNLSRAYCNPPINNRS